MINISNSISSSGNYESNLKLVISGSQLEFYKFSHPIIYGLKRRKKEDVFDENGKLIEPTRIEMSEDEKQKNSARRAKRNMRRLMLSNAWRWYKGDEIIIGSGVKKRRKKKEENDFLKENEEIKAENSIIVPPKIQIIQPNLLGYDESVHYLCKIILKFEKKLSLSCHQALIRTE